jgi:hypothetical protein
MLGMGFRIKLLKRKFRVNPTKELKHDVRMAKREYRNY